MSEEQSATENDKSSSEIPARENLDFATAKSTYQIISVLVEHIETSSNLIALMASVMGEAATQSITETAAWASYLTARRSLEQIRPELERFAATVTQIAETTVVPEPTEQPNKPVEE